MNDHNVFSIMAISKPEASTSQINNDFINLEQAQAEFYANDTGPYTAPSGITNGFQQLSNETLQEIGAQAVIDAGFVNRAHVEYLYESIFYPGGPTETYIPLANESYISLTASNLVALSQGNVTIRSSSMADAPVINPNVCLLTLGFPQGLLSLLSLIRFFLYSYTLGARFRSFSNLSYRHSTIRIPWIDRSQLTPSETSASCSRTLSLLNSPSAR
jgi:hypothetical protein